MIKNGSICNDDGNSADEWDFSKFSMAAGATASEQLTNCCRKKPIVKCSQVMCASRGDSASRRRSHGASSGAYKAKAGSADTVCKSLGDCERKCCEKNPLMCGGVSPSDASTWCGTNYSTTPLVSHTAMVKPACDAVATAAMVATFTVSADNASFRSACCTPKPSKTACPANFACPEHYQSKKPMPTTLYDMPMPMHCCDMKANVTQCSAHCTVSGSSTPHSFPAAANSCSPGIVKTGCASSKCGAGQALDIYLRIDNGATATNAAIATKCCFDKPAAAMTNAKCSAFFAAAAAGATKAKTSSCMQGASLPILAVAVLMLMKF